MFNKKNPVPTILRQPGARSATVARKPELLELFEHQLATAIGGALTAPAGANGTPDYLGCTDTRTCCLENSSSALPVYKLDDGKGGC